MFWVLSGPTVNGVDFLLLLILALGVFVGLAQGLIRQALLVVACYSALVLAAQYYLYVGVLLGYVMGGDPGARNTLALVLTFAVLAIAINWATRFVYTQTALPELPAIDHAGGAAVGLALSWALAGLGLVVLQSALGINWAAWEADRQALASGIDQSSVVPIINGVLPHIYSSLRPWLPLGLPAPFIHLS